MTARNFGLTTRSAIGGNDRPSGPRISADSTRANLIPFPSRPSLERSEISKPSLEELEAFSFGLFFAVLFGPAICVGAAVLGYLLFIA